MNKDGVPSKAWQSNKAGRPEEINQEKVDKMLAAIRIGSFPEVAAAHAGINKRTLVEWLKRGAKDQEKRSETIYARFSAQVDEAIAYSETRDLNNIDKFTVGRPAEYLMQALRDDDGRIVWEDEEKKVPKMVPVFDRWGNVALKSSEIKPDWRAASWKMSKRFRNRWGENIKDNGNGAGDGPRVAPKWVVKSDDKNYYDQKPDSEGDQHNGVPSGGDQESV